MALAIVGEAFITSSVEILLNKITSSEFRDFFANRKLNVPLLNELTTKLNALNAVLNDAEEKQITDFNVKRWFDDLKDAVLDAEDLLDEINTDSLRCKVVGDSQSFATQVRSLLCCCPLNKFYWGMNSKLEAICVRLEHFVKQTVTLKLQSSNRRVSYTKITDSLVQPVVIAREDDKEKLLKMLLSDDDAKLNNMGIGVITILGMGGLGKTTLAQQVYNDSEVQKQFDLTAWAWVSDDFDVFRVTKNLVESVTKKACEITNLDLLRVELRNHLKDKKFLLVLDDLWNEKYNDWDHLITPFSSGKKGSKIIVTTRQLRVAEVTRTFPICEPKLLTDENCWHILAKHAFGNEGCDNYPILKEIGRKIARKCSGLPLAAKTLGGLLRSYANNIEEWNRILNSNLWANDDVVLPALRISYLHLPAHLKRCFAYCSMFPKQHLLDREELILLWMAEGFLHRSDGGKALELAGDDNFNELLSRSLIQKAEAAAKEKFRMHDLIYDLARLVSGSSSCCFEGIEVPKNVRYLSFQRKDYDVSKKIESFYELKSLRTFLPHSGYNLYQYISREVPDHLLRNLKCLRVLSLSKYKNITKLPRSIGNLVHLRYLDLSNTSIRCLPDETFMLFNLQTLKLSNCEFLSQLPRQIENLVNLRHLDVRNTNLEEMPPQISKLQNLSYLSTFVVGKQDGLRIGELRNLPYLQGALSILKLQNVVDPRDASEANLKGKEQIEELGLEWGSDTPDSQMEKDVLEMMQPSTKIRKLNIRFYSGTSFPNWIGDSSFSCILSLRISDCNYCCSLPPFGQLPYLKELFISRMKMVQTIGDEFYCSNTVSSSFQPFPSLESLEFEDMSDLQEWLPFEGEGGNFPFSCLKRLRLCKCPKLRGNLPRRLPSLTEVHILECNQLEAKSSDLQWNTSFEVLNIKEGGESLLSVLDNYSYRELRVQNFDGMQSLPRMILGANCLQHLYLNSIPSLISFPTDGLPTSLQSLKIVCCENLEFLSQETSHKYTSLEQLTIEDSCHSLVSFPLGCFPALQELYIKNCSTLEAITLGGDAAPNLFIFWVEGCKKLESLQEQIDLPALLVLVLNDLPELASLPRAYLPSNLQILWVDRKLLSSVLKPELGFRFQCLTSLVVLHIYGFGSGDEDLVNTLLKEPLLPTSIGILALVNFGSLKLLEGKGLQHLTSLQMLHIQNCPSLESLPGDLLPSSLTVLSIVKCPLLEARYRSRKGKHWSKISRIPGIEINGEVII